MPGSDQRAPLDKLLLLPSMLGDGKRFFYLKMVGMQRWNTLTCTKKITNEIIDHFDMQFDNLFRKHKL